MFRTRVRATIACAIALAGWANVVRAEFPSSMPAAAPDTVTAEVTRAGDAVMAMASNRVSTRVTHTDGGLEVEGRFRVFAPQTVAWSVLTDYDGIENFVSSMRESKVGERRDDYVTVEQVAVGRMFLFKRSLHTVLHVHEEPPGMIRFEDVLHQDFERYEGEWTISEHGREIEIVYRVVARPTRTLPDFVARGVFERTIRRLLSEIGTEIEKRAALASGVPAKGADRVLAH